VRHSILPGLGADLPASVLNVLEEGESELGDLEAEIERVKAGASARPALPAAQDMDVEEVWEALMMWCGSYEDTLNQSQIEMLGHGLDVWRVEGFRPVLQARNAPFCTGDVYLILNRVDDREGAIGAVDEAYHMRRTRVRTLWTMHFWIGREAHPLKAGVAAVLAKELCTVLKRHARPIREVEGEESDILRAIYPKGIKSVPGACPHGFRHMQHVPRTPRLIRVQTQAAKGGAGAGARGKPVSALVPLEAQSLHDHGAFILDTEDAIFQFVGAKVWHLCVCVCACVRVCLCLCLCLTRCLCLCLCLCLSLNACLGLCPVPLYLTLRACVRVHVRVRVCVRVSVYLLMPVSVSACVSVAVCYDAYV